MGRSAANAAMPEPQIQRFAEQQIRRPNDADSIARDVVEKLFFELAKFPGVATRNDHYLALAYAIRDRLLHRWVQSARTYLVGKHRTLIYLSAEYLIGPQLAATMTAGAGWVSLDVTAYVRAQLAGDKQASFALFDATTARTLIRLWSREGAYPPLLELH